MSLCWFWSVRGSECLNGELRDIDTQVGTAIIEREGRTHVVPIEDVQPCAIDEWFEENGQFGVGA